MVLNGSSFKTTSILNYHSDGKVVVDDVEGDLLGDPAIQVA